MNATKIILAGILAMSTLFSCGKKTKNQNSTENKIKSEMIQNNIEIKLSNLNKSEISEEEFIKNFLESELYLCLPKGQVDKESGAIKENPTFFTLSYPTHISLCFYTSEKMAKKTFSKFPNFEEIAKVKVKDVLYTIKGNEFGIVINPYCDLHKIYSLEKSKEILSKI